MPGKRVLLKDLDLAESKSPAIQRALKHKARREARRVRSVARAAARVAARGVVA